MNSSLCLTEEQMRLAGTAFESFLMRYVFPVVFVFGVLGNLTNLCVFLHPKMRSRSNILLAALAIADVAFLLLVLPHSLANYDYFALSNSFRVVYFYAKTHLVAFANWFSACSVWIIVAICVDRLLLARSRILSLSYNRRYVPLAVWLISIVVGTFLLTFYNHVAYDCYQFHYCNGSQVYSMCVPVTSRLWRKDDVTPHSQLFRSLIRFATVLHAILVVLIPNVVIAILNCALIYELKRRNDCLPLIEENGTTSRRRKERRAVITVCAIVTCFTLTQGPSGWLHLWLMVREPKRLFGTITYNLIAITNCLVCTGKSVNFLLFCLSSKPYRKHLRVLNDHFRCKYVPQQRSQYDEAKANFEMASLQQY